MAYYLTKKLIALIKENNSDRNEGNHISGDSRNAQNETDKDLESCNHKQAGDNPRALLHDNNSQNISISPSSASDLTPKTCLQCKSERRNARKYRWKLILSLLLPYLLASLDVTVVATALPFIASHFNKFDQLNWIVTSYTLTSTAFIPAYGQLADVFGRHTTLQVSMFFMTVGSTLCAAAQTWAMLLFGRAIQGLSSAGIMNIIKIILADKVSLKENAKNNTFFALIAGASFSIGPVIGGYLTDSNWRYCFVISIPIAVTSQVLIFFVLRKELVGGTYKVRDGFPAFLAGISTIDAGGTVIFIVAITLIILATTWGGSTYAWSDVAVVVPLILGGVLFFLFWGYEYLLEPGRAIARLFPRQDPMIPWFLFERKDTFVLAIISFATGAAMYSAFYFIGIYFTLVEGYEASKAGVQLLYYIPGIGAGVYLAMFCCNVWPMTTFHPLFAGTVIEAVGMGMLAWAVTTRRIALVNGMMGLAGAGSGLRLMPNNLHAAGVWPERLAPTLSLTDFFQPFGGTLALAIMGAVFNNKMADVFLGGTTADAGFNVHNTESLDSIARLPQAAQDSVRSSAKKAVMWSFISITPIMAISVFCAILLGNVWIGHRKGKKMNGTESMVLYSPYLLGVLKGTTDSERVVTKPLSNVDKERQAEELRRRKMEKPPPPPPLPDHSAENQDV